MVSRIGPRELSAGPTCSPVSAGSKASSPASGARPKAPRTPPSEVEKIAKETAGERHRVRALVKSGRWREAERDATRASAYDARRRALAGAETVQGPTNDLQQVQFLFEGARARRAVAYVEVTVGNASSCASGFMVSPRLFLTNSHVIGDADAARGAQITFDREALASGRRAPETTFLLDPDRFALFSPNEQLDYALVAVGERTVGTLPLEEFGYCAISDSRDRHRIGMNVNIIQHPGGLPKMIAIRNNILNYSTDTTLLYETDTDHGTSGSPVFNDLWELVALHHWGYPFIETVEANGEQFPENLNEGVRISSIYADLVRRLPSLAAPQRALLEEALSFARKPTSSGGPPTLSPPRPEPADVRAGAESTPLQPQRSLPTMTEIASNVATFTIPIQVTVRVGGDQPTTVVGPALAAPRTSLKRGAEVAKVDTDYGNRTGYQSSFIPGNPIALPTLSAALQKEVAALRAGEDDAASGLLRYEHFSVVMHRSKRMAIFTATNIDGATYLSVNRNTGQANDGGAEADRWFVDPRVSETFCTGQSFYSAWSHLFDRGHLTRRNDPTWGDAESAERANADTFHWTNCSPQHFRFNQTTKYWQGAERYVLENGVLDAEDRKRIVVFQGPIFDSKIDQYADDLQIPSSFFKVIVWLGRDDVLKSVGLVVDQVQLLGETRSNLGQPHDVASVQVNQWRVAIADITRRTGLSFDQKVVDADTHPLKNQPKVGEAAVRLTSLEGILG